MKRWVTGSSAFQPNVPSSFSSLSGGGSEDERGDAGSRHVFSTQCSLPWCLGSSEGGWVHKEAVWENTPWSYLLALGLALCES